MRNFTLLILLMSYFQCLSQNITICGTIKDTVVMQPIMDANIMIFKVGDSIPLKKVISNVNGFFAINRLQLDTFFLIISKSGYSDKLIYLSKTDSSVMNLHVLALSKKSVQLNEVVINAYNTPIFYKKDTLVYIADSFRLKQNATVEDLLKKLPGLKINAQGKIVYKGKVITELLVDGENFFGKDVTVATRNLNADGIESVQVYERPDDNNGQNNEKQKVLNLKLKENAKNGWFGKIAVATDFRKFYEGNIFANRFRTTEKAAISLVSGNTPYSIYRDDNIYKVNDRDNKDDSNEEENYTSNELQRLGVPKIFNPSIYYSKNIGKNDKLIFNYSYINNPITILQTETNQFILKDTSFTTANERYNLQKLNSHDINLKLNHKINQYTEFELQPNFVQSNVGISNLQKTSFFSQSGDLVSLNTINNTSKSIVDNLNTSFILKRKFKKIGKLFRVNYNSTIQNSHYEGILKSRNTYYNLSNPNDSINQQKLTKGAVRANNIILFYKNLLSKTTAIECSYNLNFSKINQNKQAKNYANGEYSSYDSSLTNSFVYNKITNDFNSKITYERKKNIFRFGFHVRQVKLNSKNIFPSNEIKRSIKNFLPYINYEYKINNNSNLIFNYITSSDLPQIAFLQPVKDNTNPTQIIIGNLYLLPTFNHNFNLSYDLINPKNGANLWSNFNFVKRNNDFSVSSIYDSLGRSIEKIVNVNGNYQGSFTISSSILLFSNVLELSPNIILNSEKAINYVNNQVNIQKNSNANLGGGISINLDTIVLALSGNYGYNTSSSTLNNGISKPYYTQRYSASLQLPLRRNFLIETNANFFINNRLVKGFNLSYLVWNMCLSKTFFIRKENLIISLVGNDILNQNSSVNRTINNNIITDTKTNVISRYLLLKITFKLKNNSSNYR